MGKKFIFFDPQTKIQFMKNKYFLLRHGESLKNVKNFESCWPEKIKCPLTKKGRKEIGVASKRLKTKKINLIFTSDLLRAKQTAEIIGKALNLEPKLDKRLREINIGILNGRPIDEIGKFWDREGKLSPLQYYQKRFKLAVPRGETYSEVEKRLSDFIKETNKKYKGKNILIVSHQRPLTLLQKIVHDYNLKKFVKIIMEKKEIKIGELGKL